MSENFNNLSKEELIEYINNLRRQLNNEKYGLYFDRKATPEDVVEQCKVEIPLFLHDTKLDILNKGGENFLVEGDNFQALTALNLINKSDGLIDAIYIDPPYNTGKKDFIYNDKFLDADDGFKHTKWLNFMEKRLILARNILKEDGVIFISIDEHEFAQLKLLCDSIFGEQNFVENFIWIKNSTKNLSNTTSTNHEYVLSYAKNITEVSSKQLFRIAKPGFREVKQILKDSFETGLSENETQIKIRRFYKNNPELKGISMYNRVEYSKDKKGFRAFRLSDISAPKATGRGAIYDVIHPITGKVCKTPSRGWAYTKETMQSHIDNDLIYFYESHENVPAYKRYLDTVSTEVMKSHIVDFNEGKKELVEIFGIAPFDNAKPTTLISHLLQITKPDAIILDFFAGSGTTGHAVLNINEEDGGNRRFILVTNNEGNIMSDVCYPRLKAVITGKRKDESIYSQGKPANLRYFRIDYVKDNPSRDQAKFNIVDQLDSLLCFSELTFEKIYGDFPFNIYSNLTKTKTTSIFNTYFDAFTFKTMLNKALEIKAEKNVIYYFSLDNNVDLNIEKQVKKVIENADVKPIPSKIYEIYKRIADDLRRDY